MDKKCPAIGLTFTTNKSCEEVFVAERYMNVSLKKTLEKFCLYNTQECDRCYFGNAVTVGTNKAANNHVHCSYILKLLSYFHWMNSESSLAYPNPHGSCYLHLSRALNFAFIIVASKK